MHSPSLCNTMLSFDAYLRGSVSFRLSSLALILPLTAHFSLLAVNCSLLTAHCSLLTAHCSLLTAHCSLVSANCTLHYSQSAVSECPCSHSKFLTAHYSLLTAHYTLLTALCSDCSERLWLLPVCTALSRVTAGAWQWQCHREYIEKRAVRGCLCSLLTATNLFWCHEQRAAHTWRTPQLFPGGIVWVWSFVEITMSERKLSRI